MAKSIPATHKALLFETYGGPLKLVELPVPVPGDDELLVKILYSGICHSDMAVWAGAFKQISKEHHIGGHEGAGEVQKVGLRCKGFKVGDKVGIKLFNQNCLNCAFCKNSQEPCCPYGESVGLSKDGTFQEYMTIRATDAIKIPDGTSLAAAAPILCAGLTAYKALKESNVRPGQIIAITGAGGGLGSHGIQYAKAMGMRVIAIDHPSKEQHCRSLGAEWFVDGFNTSETAAKIIEISKGGPHGVVNFAGARSPMEQALTYVRKQGTVVFVGLAKDSLIGLDTTPFVFKNLTVKGSFVGNRLDADEAMEFVSRGVVKVPLEIIKLEDVPKIYEKMINGSIVSRAVIDFSL